MPPIWLDEDGQCTQTRPCHVLGCTREWPVRRYHFKYLDWGGWPTNPMIVVNWSDNGQRFVPWPEAARLWALMPVVEAVAI
jgi:hypothetical protein